MTCPHCSAALAEGARFCGTCGKAVSPTESSTNLPAARPADLVGTEIAGRYRILAKLGEGGMGAVYRAEQISLKRVCALKVLKAELSADATLVRRFNAEAELAAKLNHPNTVTLYDFGQHEDGSLFIAMELIEGESLRDVLIAGGPVEIGRALKIGEQVAASLADAHQSGIVHRDLKPDNIMLSVRGRETDVVRVLDFGIAKLRDERGDVTAQPMTQAGDLLGTPQYMAPEQIKGETVDGRTDIYALGAVLYETVTGRLPFEGPTLMAIVSKHVSEMPVPPRQRRPDLAIPAELERLIMTALQKPPAARPQSMEEVEHELAGLRATVTGAPVSTQVPTGAPVAIRPPGVPLSSPGLTPDELAHAPTGHATPAGAHAFHPPVPTPHPPHPPQPPPPLPAASGSRAGLWIGLAAVVAAAAGGTIYLATRGGDDGDRAATSDDGDDDDDDDDRRTFSPDDFEVDLRPGPATEPGESTLDDKTLTHPSRGYAITVPGNFIEDPVDNPAAMDLTGAMFGSAVQISLVSGPPMGQSDEELVELGRGVAELIGGPLVDYEFLDVQGRRRLVGIADADAHGMRFQFVVYAEADSTLIAAFGINRDVFDRAGAFRAELFEDRIRLGSSY